MAINNFTHIAACQLAVLTNLQFVGIHIVDAVSALQILAEISKSARENSNLIATALEDSHQTVNTFGDGQVLCNLLHHANIEPF